MLKTLTKEEAEKEVLMAAEKAAAEPGKKSGRPTFRLLAARVLLHRLENGTVDA